MTAKDLAAVFAEAAKGEAFYWNCCDGHCSGTEFVWMPNADRWVYRDNDNGKVGQVTELTLILSHANGDKSGLNYLGDLIAADFEQGAGLWVLSADLPDDFELPDDAEVYNVANPVDGLQPVELTAAN